jgi:hypothetical protein
MTDQSTGPTGKTNNPNTCTFLKVKVDGQFDHWELKSCNCKQPGGYCMTPEATEVSEDVEVIQVPCFEIGETCPELPDGNTETAGNRSATADNQRDHVYIHLPVIVRLADRYVTNGAWINCSVGLQHTGNTDIRLAGGWAISVRKFEPIPSGDAVMQKTQPTGNLAYSDIAVPILIGLPESTKYKGLKEIRHYWLLTSNKSAAEGRAQAVLISHEWLVSVSHPIVSSL